MNRMNLLRGIIVLSVFGSGMFACPWAAAETNTLLVPTENVAYFDAASQQVQVQLVKPSGVGNRPLEGTKVIVVGPTGA